MVLALFVDAISLLGVGAGFCWSRAIKPGILSLEEGVGWTYTCNTHEDSGRSALALYAKVLLDLLKTNLALREQKLHPPP